MIKPPSNIKTWPAFYSGDDAIIQPANEASDEQRADRMKRIERARETGLWDDVRVPDQQPTIFMFKPLSSSQTGELVGMLNDARSQRELYKVYETAFLLSIVEVKNLADAGEVDRFPHPTFGSVATAAFLDRAGCSGELGAAIMIELGQHVLKRARVQNPKS